MGCRRRDHPRTCGEHVTGRPLILSAVGSSPRSRGTQIAGGLRYLGVGIIPALAGNTRPDTQCCPMPRDHPRACREHRVISNGETVIAGSSPRLRGTHLAVLFVHALAGSSPRLRGTLHDAVDDDARPGIIPALAGNTVEGVPIHPLGRDYPRACGEHHLAQAIVTRSQGSSPRLRGTRKEIGNTIRYSGIIPALAGNTFTRL